MATNLADFGGAAHHVSRRSAARLSQAGRKFSASDDVRRKSSLQPGLRRHLMSLAHLGRVVLLAAAATLPQAIFAGSAQAKPTVEVAFVLDTTGSMSGLIEGAKRKIWSIATTIVDSNPDAEIRMGLVAYRDIGDDYVTRKVELTRDIQDLYARLLELKARGGGDWPESVNEALDVAVNKLQWTSGGDTRRIVFLVGDAPPHMDYEQDAKYPLTLKVAKQKDIIVNAVLA